MKLAVPMFKAAIGAMEGVLIDHVRALIAAEVERQLAAHRPDPAIEIMPQRAAPGGRTERCSLHNLIYRPGEECCFCYEARRDAAEVDRRMAEAYSLIEREFIERRAKIGDEAAGGQTSEAAAEPVSRVVGDRAPTATSELMDVTAGETAMEPDLPEPDPVADPDLDRPEPEPVPAEVSLLDEVEAFLVDHKMAPTTFGALCGKGFSFVDSLRKGRRPTARIASHVRDFMRAREVATDQPVTPARLPTADDASGCEGPPPEGSSDGAGVKSCDVANGGQSRISLNPAKGIAIDLAGEPSAMDARFANGVPAKAPIVSTQDAVAFGEWDDAFEVRRVAAAARAAGAAVCRCGIAAIPAYVSTCLERNCPGKLRA